MVDTRYIKGLIAAMGFAPLDGANEVYSKTYSQHNDYPILVDFVNSKINYITEDDEKCIRVWDETTSNFAKPENFVVLECVDRLITKGYAPGCIELEKRYPLGRREKGRLDILVNSPDGTPYILIECKTWGAEFEKEQALMNRSGGQLFSYYANERAAEFLCLYTSKIDAKSLLFKNVIVPVEHEWKELSGTSDILKAWSGNFKNNGIFEADKVPYNVVHTALTYGELQTITEEHSGKIFDLIMEILRHNVVSDKPNAFNKLLNLFVCKIIDEDRQPEDVVDFQLLDSDGKYDLQMRLNDLYQKGMRRFLNIRVTDYSEREIDELTAIGDDAKRKELKDVITRLRLQKNPEFAFVEVCDDKTFEANDKILREIVGLLQGFKFRYAQKHQFLGDFFELLLNTSIKQESGQFFTPVPITRFILSAMPLEQKVMDGVAQGDPDEFLPTAIDYACGSGHFLTEYMERMQNIVDSADFSRAKPSIKRMVSQYRDDGKFSWADKYVYGIDLDYRLVKTTKVSAFFNGDGEAQIIWANGLGNFSHTPEYLGKLRNVSRIDKRDNASFDILISNPPYSVDAFKATLDCGAETFELFNDLTDKSKEVECLFVERMKQLLKVGGWAGIILPSSIMTNGGLHAKAREILFKYFKFKAIAEMGSGTFMKTGTNTVILFLERRENTDWQMASHSVDKFFEDYRDVTVLGIEHPFSKYSFDVRGEKLEEYTQFIKSAEKEVVETEKDKLITFILTDSQTIVLIKSGQKQDEKAFLGYEFSERRGREGLRFLQGGGKLFDENNLLNSEKVSGYIYNAFLGNKPMSVDSAVEKHVSYELLSTLVNYNTSVWSKQVLLTRKTQISTKRYPLAALKDLSDVIERGASPRYGRSSVQVIKSGQARGYYTFDFSEKYYLSEKPASDGKLLKRGDLLINSTGVGTAGRVTYFDLKGEFVADSHITVFRANEKVLPKYVAQCLFGMGFKAIEAMALGQSGQIEISIDTIKHIKVPLPPLDVQRCIIMECEAFEDKIESVRKQVDQRRGDADSLFVERFGDPIQNVNGCPIANLGELIVSANNGLSRRGTDDSGDIVLRLVELQDGFLDYSNPNRIKLTDSEKSKYLLLDGDFLFARVNGNPDNVGRCAVFKDIGESVYHNDHIIRVRFNNSLLDSVYASYLLNSEYGKSEMRKMVKTTAGQFTVNQTDIKSIRIPLPPLNEQKEFAKVIEKQEKDITRLQQQIDGLEASKSAVLEKYL